jgi:omega-6 fatty acid desaturase (delta-12 desaturase)
LRSVLLTLALIPLSSAFLLRSFIVFHDCAHGSFFASRKANTWVGRIVATMVMAPFAAWRHEHNVHHATSGDLDKRGTGDVPTMTLREYQAASPTSRFLYKAFRNNSKLLTDAALAVVIALLVWAIGIGDLMLIWAPPALLAGAAGVFLFYVQHQFEDAYWARNSEWSYADAALRGSSFFNLPLPLAWATGNIGYHHIHHLSSKVPFYKLPRTHRENDVFHSVPVLTIRDGLRCTRFKLYDEADGRLITWAEARTALGRTPAGAPASAPLPSAI